LTVKETLPIYLVEIEPGNYHLFISAKLGIHKVWLLLDTGASKTAFDNIKIENMFGSNKMEIQEIHSVGLGSNQVQTHLRILKSIKLGAIKISKVEVAVLDLSHVNEAYKMLGCQEIGGVLGSDILILLKAHINLDKLQLQLKQQSITPKTQL
jgi:hypothetical protein